MNTTSIAVSQEIKTKLNESSDFIFMYEDRNATDWQDGKGPRWLTLSQLISIYIGGDLVPDGEIVTDIYEVILRPAKHSDLLNAQGIISEAKYIFYNESCSFDKNSEHYLNEDINGINLSEVHDNDWMDTDGRERFYKPWHTASGGNVGDFTGNEILAEAFGKALDDLGFKPPAVHAIEFDKEIQLKRVGKEFILVNLEESAA